MNQSLLNRRIPNVFAIVLLVVGLGVLYWLNSNHVIFFGDASIATNPDHVRISNVSDTSFTISYKTKDAVLGTISYGTDASMGSVGLDDRDQVGGTPKPYTTHHITIKNAKPSTKYFFSVHSGDDTFLNDKAPFELTTGGALTDAPSQQAPITGKIITPDGSAHVDAIVYVTSDTTQTLSTLTKDDGTYTIPLNTLRTSDNAAYATITPETKLKILAVGSSGQSEASIAVKDMNPVPFITLSKNYDFTVSLDELENPDATASADQGFPSFTAFQAANDDPKILTPKKDQTFSDQQPTFTGVAQPNQSITITVNSEQTITSTVRADASGNWKYRPTTALKPGTHTITITTKDKFNIVKTFTQSFVVFAEGSQFTEPSVSPAQTVTPTVSPTAPPQPTQTPAPTQVIPPTAAPTVTPIPTTVIQPTGPVVTRPPLPKTGNSPAILLSFIAVGSIIIGMIIFAITHSDIFV